MGNKAVSDAGPVIHLSEIDMFCCFSVFETVYVPKEVYDELKASDQPGNDEIDSDIFTIIEPDHKDRSVYFSQKFEISLADGAVIAAAREKGINIVLTDDLEVRDVVRSYGIRPVGSIGILLRAYRENLITFIELDRALDGILQRSSLYITARLVERVRSEVKGYGAEQG